jgi:excisionase family DNA binding protein
MGKKISLGIENKQCYSIDEAAAVLGVSTTTLFRTILSKKTTGNKLYSFKMGRRRLIPRKAIEDYLIRQMGEAS